MATSAKTILFLHGFSSNGSEYRDKISHVIPRDLARHHRLVFPNARIRPISCYNGARYRSWHDYLTNYGDDGVAQEEEVADYEESIQDLLRLRPSAVIGESQGACVAYEVGRRAQVPTIMMYGQRYSWFPKGPPFRLSALVGMRDRVIPPVVSIPLMPNYARIKRVNQTHADMSGEAEAFLKAALRHLFDESAVE